MREIMNSYDESTDSQLRSLYNYYFNENKDNLAEYERYNKSRTEYSYDDPPTREVFYIPTIQDLSVGTIVLDPLTGYFREIVFGILNDEGTVEDFRYKFDLIGYPRYKKDDPYYVRALMAVSTILGSIPYTKVGHKMKEQEDDRIKFKSFLKGRISIKPLY